MLLARQKTMLATVTVCALIIILTTLAYIAAADRVGREQLAPEISDAFADILQIQLTHNITDLPTLQSMLERFTRHFQIREAALYNNHGERLSHSYRNSPLLSARLEDSLLIDKLHKYRLSSPRGELQLLVISDRSLPGFFILDTLTTTLFVVSISALLIFALYALTRRWQKRPYLQLLNNVRRATRDGEKEEAVTIHSDDPDIQPLTSALNDLLWQYDQRTLNLRNAHQQAESARLRATRLSTETRQINENLAQEISVRRGIETQLKNTQTLLDGIINAMPSALFTLDAQLRIVQCNQQAGDWLGKQRQQLTGRHLLQLIPELAPHADLLNAAEQNSAVHKLERLAINSFMQPLMTDTMIYPLPEQQQAKLVLRIDDVSQRLQLEEIMVHSEKMMTVAGLATGIAHEINNPLGAILQNLQNIRRRLQPGLSANERIAAETGLPLENLGRYLQQRDILQFMDNIQQAGERAANIIANMLQFSRSDQQQKQRTDLNALINNTLSIARGDFGLRHIQLQFHTTEQPAWVECLPGEIEQVLLNLLKNSVQALSEYQPDDAQWQPNIHLSIEQRDQQQVIVLEDNGPGISAASAAHIFEPFYTTKDVGEGTGLGLFVSYLIITSHHHGQLRYRASTQYGGACFEIALPAGD
ncbi:two-component system sensor histidine kinase NtrB [Thalassolituus hydrocarboniclasticus]|uniref:histidine kinase n=1 Tax=Thalassolituus hydrocarboniclasticus TaxID=2742796 RepID=A0ABY6AEM2_9GAMM|nr:ATP-binding protein [Thalassolituus hydrocarboniclasticus]UXD88449.1 PAS domain-containing protein [Thalassolituus hydrocarboniclasticus]